MKQTEDQQLPEGTRFIRRWPHVRFARHIDEMVEIDIELQKLCLLRQKIESMIESLAKREIEILLPGINEHSYLSKNTIYNLKRIAAKAVLSSKEPLVTLFREFVSHAPQEPPQNDKTISEFESSLE